MMKHTAEADHRTAQNPPKLNLERRLYIESPLSALKRLPSLLFMCCENAQGMREDLAVSHLICALWPKVRCQVRPLR